VEVAEQFADGRATTADLTSALSAAWRAYHDVELTGVRDLRVRSDPAWQASLDAAQAVGWGTQEEDPRVPARRHELLGRINLVFSVISNVAHYASRIGRRQGENVFVSERAAQAALLRDIFGNPFGASPRMSPDLFSWNSGTVVKLAQAI